LSLTFVGAALVFWVVVGVRLLSRERSSIPRKLPPAFHASGVPCRELPSFAPYGPSDLKARLSAVEQASLVLLLADRLSTFGWSKSMVWRFVRSRKTLSPVGTLTGTYYAVEALGGYGYLRTKSAHSSLAANLALVLAPDGVVVQSVQLTGSGVRDSTPENLRHSSACFLLRTMLADKASRADIILAARIGADLGGRLRVEHRLDAAEGHRDTMGSAFATAAVLAGLAWLPPSSLDEETTNLGMGMLDILSDLPELSTLGHPSWGLEPGAAAAGQTTAQWVVVWLLASMAGWSRISDQTRLALARRLLDLIEANLHAVPNTDKLLPHSFSLGGGRSPCGESMLATATACHVATLLQPLIQDAGTKSRCESAIRDLLTRIGQRGLDYVTIDSIEEPYEGYLTWASVLIALRPYLYRGTEAHGAPSRLAAAEKTLLEWERGNEPLPSDEPWMRTAFRTVSRIDALLRETGVTPGSNGLYQEL